MGPLQALAALHLFWLLMVLPPVWMAANWLSPPGLRRLGAGLVALGSMGLVAGAAIDVHLWLRESPPEFRAYTPQRLGFFLVNCTDIPLPHILVAGLVCLGLARRRSAACNPAQPR